MSWRENRLADTAAEALGEPNEVFYVSRQRQFYLIILAVGLIAWGLFGSIGLYLIGGNAFKFAVIKFYLLLFATPFILGLTIIYRTYKSKGMTVLMYPSAILTIQGQEVFTCFWDEIAAIYIKGSNDANLTHSNKQKRMILPGRRFAFLDTNNFIEIKKSDGSRQKIFSSVPQFPKLIAIVQNEVFNRLYPVYMQQLNDDKAVKFGNYVVSEEKLKDTDKMKETLWGKVKVVSTTSGVLLVKLDQFFGSSFSAAPLYEIPNPHLFLTIAYERIQAAGQTKNDEKVRY